MNGRSSSHARVGFSLMLMLALSVFSTRATAGDSDNFACDTLEGWAMLNIFGGDAKGTLQVVKKDLEFKYDRGDLTVLTHTATLADFLLFRMNLQSEKQTIMAIAVEDTDGAKFNFGFTLPPNRETEIRCRPGDFKLSDDSKVKKRALDPAKLKNGFALVDVSIMQKKKGPNALQIKNLAIERKPVAKMAGDTVIDHQVAIDKPVTYDGNITIRRGGHLLLKKSPRAIFNGNIRIEDGGIFEVAGGTCVIPQDFNHQRSIDVKSGGRCIFKDGATINTGDKPIKLDLHGKASYTVDNCKFAGGVTCTLEKESKVALTKADKPGEFIIPPGSESSFTECAGPIVWLTLGDNFNGQLICPDGGLVRDFKPGHGLNMTVTNCAEVAWCLLSLPGSAGRVEFSIIFAAGLYFDGNSGEVVVKDLHGGKPLEKYLVDAADRRLRLNTTTVNTWNLYAGDKSNVKVSQSKIGEAFAFGSGSLRGHHTVIDGSGGYICAHQKSQIVLEDCAITCAVVARDTSSITLINCDIKGDIHALGTATVKMVNCKHVGKTNKDEKATLTTEPAK